MRGKTTITFSFLYKNGHEDVYRQEVTQENAEELKRLIKNIQESMKVDAPATLTLGNGVDDGMFVRLQDVCRVMMKEENKLKTCVECGKEAN